MISKKLEDLRKERKLTLDELATKSGFSLQGLYKAIKNDDFRISQLESLSKALDVDISYFFSNSEENFKADLHHILDSGWRGIPKIMEFDNSNCDIEVFTSYIKDRLVQLYLNTIYLNPNLFQFKSASNNSIRFYPNSLALNFAEFNDLNKPVRTNVNKWLHPVDINMFLKTECNITKKEILQSIKKDIEQRELEFVKKIETNAAINWMIEVDLLDSTFIKTILLIIGREYYPTIKITEN